MSELSRDRTPPAAGLPTLMAKAAAWDYLVGRVGDARALDNRGEFFTRMQEMLDEAAHVARLPFPWEDNTP